MMVASAWGAELKLAETGSTDIKPLFELHQRWNLAVNSNDIAGILAVLDDNIELIPPDGPEVIGKAAFGQMLEGVFASNTFRIEVMAPIEIRVDNDIAWSRYTYRIHRTPKDAATVFISERRYLDVFRRQPDGTWRVLKHIWNYPGGDTTP